MLTTESFNGLAFTSITVKYFGPTDHRSARWIATWRYDNERTFRAQGPTDRFTPLGTAQLCYAKGMFELEIDYYSGDRIFVPGNHSPSEYVYLVIPSEYLNK